MKALVTTHASFYWTGRKIQGVARPGREYAYVVFLTLDKLFTAASIFHQLAVWTLRLLALLHPLRYQEYQRLSAHRPIILFLWAVVLMFTVPIPIFMCCPAYARNGRRLLLLNTIFCVYLPLLATICINFFIVMAVRKRRRTGSYDCKLKLFCVRRNSASSQESHLSYVKQTYQRGEPNIYRRPPSKVINRKVHRPVWQGNRAHVGLASGLAQTRPQAVAASELCSPLPGCQAPEQDFKRPPFAPAVLSGRRRTTDDQLGFSDRSDLSRFLRINTWLTSNTASQPERLRSSSDVSTLVVLIEGQRTTFLRFREKTCSHLQCSMSEVKYFRSANSEPLMNSTPNPLRTKIPEVVQVEPETAKVDGTQEKGENVEQPTRKQLQPEDAGDRELRIISCGKNSSDFLESKRRNKRPLLISNRIRTHVMKRTSMLAVGFTTSCLFCWIPFIIISFLNDACQIYFEGRLSARCDKLEEALIYMIWLKYANCVFHPSSRLFLASNFRRARRST
ncbi:hypothetical protein AAHC03_05593 [Spirometra sp. Aus1]